MFLLHVHDRRGGVLGLVHGPQRPGLRRHEIGPWILTWIYLEVTVNQRVGRSPIPGHMIDTFVFEFSFHEFLEVGGSAAPPGDVEVIRQVAIAVELAVSSKQQDLKSSAPPQIWEPTGCNDTSCFGQRNSTTR